MTSAPSLANTSSGTIQPDLSHLVDLIARIICTSFRQDYRLLFEHASNDCVLISACGPVFNGLEDMRAHMGKRVKLPQLIVRDARFRVTRAETLSEVTVVGSFTTYSDFTTDRTIISQHMQVSMGAHWDGGTWRIHTVHFSADNKTPDGDFHFPVAVGEETYRYVLSILRANRYRGAREERLIISQGTTETFVNPQLVLYAEARGKASVLHLVAGKIEVRKLLAELQDLLPRQFARISRKHIVNCAYVVSVDSDAVELPGNVRLAIPKRRSQSVRQEILARVRDLQETGKEAKDPDPAASPRHGEAPRCANAVKQPKGQGSASASGA